MRFQLALRGKHIGSPTHSTLNPPQPSSLSGRIAKRAHLEAASSQPVPVPASRSTLLLPCLLAARRQARVDVTLFPCLPRLAALPWQSASDDAQTETHRQQTRRAGGSARASRRKDGSARRQRLALVPLKTVSCPQNCGRATRDTSARYRLGPSRCRPHPSARPPCSFSTTWSAE